MEKFIERRKKSYLYEMRQNTIYDIGNKADELYAIDYQLKILIGLGNTVIEFGVKDVGFIIETLPNNGARPLVLPLYPQPLNPFQAMMLEEEESKMQPIGFKRYYQPDELSDKTGMITLHLELSQDIALAIIDTAIKRLKRQK